VAGLRRLDGIHGEPADRVGHAGGIDARHDENPPEMSRLLMSAAAKPGRRHNPLWNMGGTIGAG
jgi:hypothetical protein